MKLPVASLMLVLSAGCAATAATPSPSATLTRFAELARRGDDPASLWAMLPARARRAERFEDFRDRIARDRAELAALGAAVSEGVAARRPQADVTLRDGPTVTVVPDEGAWRVAEPGFGPPVAVSLEGIAGARAAVRALHRALRLHGPGAWTELLSARARGALVAEAAALADATADPGALEVSEQRTRVVFTLPDGRRLDVVFEAGAWRIDGLRDP